MSKIHFPATATVTEVSPSELPHQYSTTTKAAIAAILLAGTSAIAFAADTSSARSSESSMWSTTELLLHLWGTALLGAFVYCATKRPRNWR